MSLLVNQILEFGISENTIILILMLPIVATFIAFCRQIIGIRGFGIYITSILGFAFDATHLKYGLVLFFIIIITGSIMRLLVRKIRILYLPRMAMLLTVVAFAIFLTFLLGKYLDIGGLKIISIFPVLIMILLVERFVAAQIERGTRDAIVMTGETLVLAIISYFLINWPWLQDKLLSYTLLSLLGLLIFNFLIGKWTGLRLTEYFRFKELISYLRSKNKES